MPTIRLMALMMVPLTVLCWFAANDNDNDDDDHDDADNDDDDGNDNDGDYDDDAHGTM